MKSRMFTANNRIINEAARSGMLRA
jgi:hypothetical protein